LACNTISFPNGYFIEGQDYLLSGFTKDLPEGKEIERQDHDSYDPGTNCHPGRIFKWTCFFGGGGEVDEGCYGKGKL
jgi:hypothetical protein